VHNASPEVYGHLVATDLFGDGYVIPMLDTFNDITQCLGASSVELPKETDFESPDSVEHSGIDESGAETPIKGSTIKCSESGDPTEGPNKDAHPRQIADPKPKSAQTAGKRKPKSSKLRKLKDDRRFNGIKQKFDDNRDKIALNKRSYPELCFQNSWPLEFLRPRHIINKSLFEAKGRVDADGDVINIFSMDFAASSCEVEELKFFIGAVDLKM
jgi:hypothetical protein